MTYTPCRCRPDDSLGDHLQEEVEKKSFDHK
jgi:hypothetical protein